jgi:hypothetical protein
VSPRLLPDLRHEIEPEPLSDVPNCCRSTQSKYGKSDGKSATLTVAAEREEDENGDQEEDQLESMTA